MMNLTENLDRSARSAGKRAFTRISDEVVPHCAEVMLLFGRGTAYVELGK